MEGPVEALDRRSAIIAQKGVSAVQTEKFDMHVLYVEKLGFPPDSIGVTCRPWTRFSGLGFFDLTMKTSTKGWRLEILIYKSLGVEI